ncbi:pentapeptide repeat-containing protein [Flexivirga alba]|uniref:Pentapeptide repeat-containing protein n=1 Tax=Flexivirga alba TaxID=702742 RepID=A0ABW2AIA6_9MICO
MDPITTWQLSVDGVGSAEIGTGEYRYAGGFVIAVLGGSGDGWAVFNLGNSEVALAAGVADQDNHVWTYYWNSYEAMPGGYRNGSMLLWYGVNGGYSSDSIGPEQTFRVSNLGQARISLQATAGSFPGQYLSAESGGWYPHEWSVGDGSFISSPSPAPIRVSGDLLPLLQITNSGYDTDLSGRDLGALSLAATNLVKCGLAGANLTAVTSISGADFTSANLRGIHLGGHDLATAKTWAQADFTGSDLTTIAGAASAHLEERSWTTPT